MGTLAGYALGRLPMRGKFTMLVALLMISVFPEIALIAPLYLLLRHLGWLNSYQALIIPYTAFNLPFAIWILRNYMLGIPKEMEETGRIDGASPLRTVWSIILPQSLPGIFTAGIFCFTACWTEFLMALTFNISNNFRTIPVGGLPVRHVNVHARTPRSSPLPWSPPFPSASWCSYSGSS